jgi:hypothetical protein
MKNRLAVMTVLVLLLTSALLVPVSSAQPAWCDTALSECNGECGVTAFWMGLATTFVGQRWVGMAWGGGCMLGCSVGYAKCGR